MKRVLPFVLTLMSLFAVPRLGAQEMGGACTIERIGLNVKDTAQGANGCTATADVYFVARLNNPAQRFFTAHIWQRSAYPDITYGPGSNTPTAANLGSVLRTIVIENVGNAANPNWQLSRTYPDAAIAQRIIIEPNMSVRADTVPASAGGLYQQYRGFVFFRISNVSITAPGFCSNLSLAIDVWGSQSANNATVQCFNKNVSVFACQTTTMPALTASIICNNPRAFTLRFNNTNGCLPYFINFDVRADVNGNGRLDASDISLRGDADNDGFPDGSASVLPGMDTILAPRNYEIAQQNALFVVATAFTLSDTGIVNMMYDTLAVTNECAVLPVRFSSFTANRNSQNKQQVNLAWETAMEQNNKGFRVQRRTEGSWADVSFVPSQAADGNSDATLRYTFSDQNGFGGISQYRLVQEDLDGKLSFSEIKAVRGISQLAALIIYPNPATGGKATLMFGDVQAKRDVLVSDISGRMVQQHREVAGNTFEITGLVPGFYSIKVIDKRTNTMQVEKLVVR